MLANRQSHEFVSPKRPSPCAAHRTAESPVPHIPKSCICKQRSNCDCGRFVWPLARMATSNFSVPGKYFAWHAGSCFSRLRDDLRGRQSRLWNRSLFEIDFRRRYRLIDQKKSRKAYDFHWARWYGQYSRQAIPVVASSQQESVQLSFASIFPRFLDAALVVESWKKNERN